jgi:hypothetical protein
MCHGFDQECGNNIQKRSIFESIIAHNSHKCCWWGYSNLLLKLHNKLSIVQPTLKKSKFLSFHFFQNNLVVSLRKKNHFIKRNWVATQLCIRDTIGWASSCVFKAQLGAHLVVSLKKNLFFKTIRWPPNYVLPRGKKLFFYF